MRVGRPKRWALYGGMAGLVVGGLVVLGVLTLAHLGQGRSGESTTDPDTAIEQHLEEAAAESPSPPQEKAPGSTDPATAKATPFPYSTWGMLERIAAQQLDLGDEAGSFATLALIPPREGGSMPVYRTGRDKAYNLLLIRLLRRHPLAAKVQDPGGAPTGRSWLEEAETLAGRIGEGLPRAGAWLKLVEHLRRSGKADEARKYLSLAVEETRRPAAGGGAADRFGEAWERVGGWLMLLWPLGLTALGSVGAEMGRSAFEGFAEEFGTIAARWVGVAHDAGEAPARSGPSDSAPSPEVG